MMSLTMMVLTPGLLVRALFLFALMNPLVVLETPLVMLTNMLVMSVAWGLAVFFQQESIQLVTLCRWLCLYQKDSSPKVVDSY